jgi:hypothetical protein
MQRKLRRSTWRRTAAARSIVGGAQPFGRPPHLRSVAGVDRPGQRPTTSSPICTCGGLRPLQAGRDAFGRGQQWLDLLSDNAINEAMLRLPRNLHDAVYYAADCYSLTMAVLAPINARQRAMPRPKLDSTAIARSRLTAALP